MSDHVSHEPPPSPGRRRVVEAVLEDFKARAEAGKLKYGTYLETHNGRDALVDLYQELHDAVVYLKQHLMEREDNSANGRHCHDCTDRTTMASAEPCESCRDDPSHPGFQARLPCGYKPGDCCAAGTGCEGCGDNPENQGGTDGNA